MLISGGGGPGPSSSVSSVPDPEDGSEAHEPPFPPSSPIVCERDRRGVAMEVPPKGLLAGSRGLFVFAALWLVIAIPATVVVAAGLVSQVWQGDESGGGWPAVLAVLGFGAFFAALGVAMLVMAISMGRRSYQILLSADGLVLRVRGLRGDTVHHFPLAEIDRIIAAPSGMKVNDRPLYEVQIFRAGQARKALGMLVNCQDAEVQWVAHVLAHEHQRLKAETDLP